MMRRLLLTLVCLIACKDPPAAPAPAPAAPRDGVTLISPGVAPRQVLRYHLTKGAKTASELVSEVRVETDGQGAPAPALLVHVEATVEDVLADGAAKLRLTITRAAVRDSATASELALKQAAAMQGVVVTETLAADGTTSGAQVEAADTLPERVRAQLDDLTRSLALLATQLPAEPVGVGATWRERRTLPPGGIQGVSEILYTVTALTADSFAYTSAGQLSGDHQTIERDGVKVEVTNTRGRSEARGRVDLARYALDVAVTSVFSSTMNALVPEDTPGAGTSTVEITTATRLAPLAGAPPPDADQGAHKAP